MASPLSKELTMSPLRRQGSRPSRPVPHVTPYGPMRALLDACLRRHDRVVAGAYGHGMRCGPNGIALEQGSDNVTPAKAGVQTEPGGRRRPRIVLDARPRRHGTFRPWRGPHRFAARKDATPEQGLGFLGCGFTLRALRFGLLRRPPCAIPTHIVTHPIT